MVVCHCYRVFLYIALSIFPLIYLPIIISISHVLRMVVVLVGFISSRPTTVVIRNFRFGAGY
ncbi:hypothetical protein BDV33DRAFT_58878 [Aspergillus novoparasiticus]|uniref:Uncharacterized protein n=1 Tax=Aspergillus novoparasiticus TaxID=986946 RepID=A0A5N6F094_9EURO|nr:hypothetical protein BDV33DRAFT_58878 [Aspergillus novoparasiticus]